MTDYLGAQLRLPGSPSGTPARYLRLEDALNALGRQHAAGRWGQLPGWSQMPFRRLSEPSEYARHELHLRGRKARLERVPITLDLTKAEKRACIRLYLEIRSILRTALEEGKLQAYAAHPATGNETSIEAPFIWRVQTGPIFFTGQIVLCEHGQADRLAHVVLDRKLFERWLAARAKAQAKTASVKMLQDVSAAIANHRRQHEYQISRPEALALVTAIAGKHGKDVSDRQFGVHLWKPLGATAGRRTKKQQKRYEEFEDDLKMRLDALFGAASGT